MNRLKHAICVAQRVGVPQAHDLISVLTQLRGSPFVKGEVISVLSAVHLDYQAALMTAEIGAEAFDGAGALEAMDQDCEGADATLHPHPNLPPWH